ncbi:tyrosine-protein kinase SYK-like, partial [Tropilaelaps mercedesae]
IRERDDSSYALCLSHACTLKHYKVDVLSTGEFAIQDGYAFPSLMSLVSHYTLFADGLWCPLVEAVVRPDSLDENTFLKNISKATRHFFNKSPKSKLFGTIPNKGLLNKIVSSISTQGSNASYRSAKTLPRLHQVRNTEAITGSCCGDENCYPGAGESALGGVESGGGRGGGVGCKQSSGKLQKSSSIDHVLPGFIQYFMSLDGTTRRGRRAHESKLLDELACEQARSMEQHYNHYGMTVPSSGDESAETQSGGIPGARIVLTENVILNCCSGVPIPTPVPAPRTSLARRDILSEDPSDPVYVNNDQPTPTQTGPRTPLQKQHQHEMLPSYVANLASPAGVVGHDLHSQ